MVFVPTGSITIVVKNWYYNDSGKELVL